MISLDSKKLIFDTEKCRIENKSYEEETSVAATHIQSSQSTKKNLENIEESIDFIRK